MSFVIASQIALWVGLLVLAMVCLALARQVGVLHQRIAPAGALSLRQPLKLGDPTPQMICHRRLEVPALPDGISLSPVRDEQGVADFARVDTDAYATYGMPADVFVDMFDRPHRLLADAQTTIVVAYRGVEPVATALTFFSGGVASLQWVGTVAAARQMGLGRVVTVWATNVAFDLGATSVTLQASAMGEPLYTTLGYETRYRYREYVRWTAPA